MGSTDSPTHRSQGQGCSAISTGCVRLFFSPSYHGLVKLPSASLYMPTFAWVLCPVKLQHFGATRVDNVVKRVACALGRAYKPTTVGGIGGCGKHRLRVLHGGKLVKGNASLTVAPSNVASSRFTCNSGTIVFIGQSQLGSCKVWHQPARQILQEEVNLAEKAGRVANESTRPFSANQHRDFMGLKCQYHANTVVISQDAPISRDLTTPKSYPLSMLAHISAIAST